MSQIALVSHQHDNNVCICMISQLLQPPCDVLVCLVLADVVHKESSYSASVVCRCDRPVSLLSSCVPDLRLDSLCVNLNWSGCELYTDGWFRVEVELVACESAQKVGFTNTRISDQDDCKEVCVSWRRGNDSRNALNRGACSPLKRNYESNRLANDSVIYFFGILHHIRRSPCLLSSLAFVESVCIELTDCNVHKKSSVEVVSDMREPLMDELPSLAPRSRHPQLRSLSPEPSLHLWNMVTQRWTHCSLTCCYFAVTFTTVYKTSESGPSFFTLQCLETGTFLSAWYWHNTMNVNLIRFNRVQIIFQLRDQSHQLRQRPLHTGLLLLLEWSRAEETLHIFPWHDRTTSASCWSPLAE